MDIPKPVLQEAIAALEAHVQHPGTGALHDPLYAMLKGEEGAGADGISLALEAHEHHPAADEIRAILSVHVSTPAPSLVRVLARHGGTPGAAPLSETDRLLTEGATARYVLSSRVESLEAQVHVLSRTANGMAAAGALVAVLALMGWLVAMGAWEISWMEPPVPEHPEAAAAGRGQAAPNEQGVR